MVPTTIIAIVIIFCWLYVSFLIALSIFDPRQWAGSFCEAFWLAARWPLALLQSLVSWLIEPIRWRD